jgi:hypothetical protein
MYKMYDAHLTQKISQVVIASKTCAQKNSVLFKQISKTFNTGSNN